jgi:hypothetical protein
MALIIFIEDMRSTAVTIDVPNVSVSDLDPDSIRSVDLDPDSESGSRREKNNPQKQKKVKKFNVLIPDVLF